jgi:hypothetical protein
MDADLSEEETASAPSDTEQTATNEAQPREVQALLFPALIGVHRRSSAFIGGSCSSAAMLP